MLRTTTSAFAEVVASLAVTIVLCSVFDVASFYKNIFVISLISACYQGTLSKLLAFSIGEVLRTSLGAGSEWYKFLAVAAFLSTVFHQEFF